MLSTTNEEQSVYGHLQPQTGEQMALEEAAGGKASVDFPGLGVEADLVLEQEEGHAIGGALLKRTHAVSKTPAGSRRESFGGDSIGGSATKRRGRPRGWTDARIHKMLNYLEANMAAYKSVPHIEFYTGLCAALEYDLSDVAEVQEKAEKMVKKYENDTRRGDSSWKWYSRLNAVFGGPPIVNAYPGGRLPTGLPIDDDAASSSLDSDDGEEDDENSSSKKSRMRGEDVYLDRLDYEKLKLKLQKLRSKTDMRFREWEAAVQKQAAAYEIMKAKTDTAIERLEKSVKDAGYLLEQAEIMVAEESSYAIINH